MGTRNDYTPILLSHDHVSVTPPTVVLHNGKVRIGNLAEFSFLLKYTYTGKLKSGQNFSSVSQCTSMTSFNKLN